MTLSATAREFMARRVELTEREQEIIDEVFSNIYLALPCAPKDDRAAELEAALVRFVLETRPAAMRDYLAAN